MNMNNELWQKILDFDFDNSGGDYTFTVRLASENRWTDYFTQQALQEYRKFMYLAATASAMVCPSEIVDVVWHQHLIFTKSYREFCALLGKDIQHIPSTHSKTEAATFIDGATRTAELYNAAFGQQPKEIWTEQSMLGGLHLKPSAQSPGNFLMFAMPAVLLLLGPVYYFLKPIYTHISNPTFPILAVALCIIVIVALRDYNRNYLKRFINSFESNSFLFNLTPFEVVYLKQRNIEAVVNGSLGELLHEELVRFDRDSYFSVIENRPVNEKYMRLGMKTILEHGQIGHKQLLQELVNKRLFYTIKTSMDALDAHLRSSGKIVRLFCFNFVVLAIAALLVYTRLVTGLMLGKPVTFIALISIAFTIVALVHLKSLFEEPLRKTLPSYYLKEKLSDVEINNDWQWLYLLKGPALLNVALLTVAYPNHKGNEGWGDNSSGSSCGSSCGGGGCGGCGGD